MEDKELIEIVSHEYPPFNNKCKEVYENCKKSNIKRLSRKKILVIIPLVFVFAIIGFISVYLIKGDLNVFSGEETYANKFVQNDEIVSSDLVAGPIPRTFLEFDRSWYKVLVSPVNEYICFYLKNDVYDAIVDVIDDYCCFRREEFKKIKKEVRRSFLSYVNGDMGNLYFYLSKGSPFASVNGKIMNLQDYFNYQGRDIIIDDNNYMVTYSNDINNLPIKYKDYTAMAYFYYQDLYFVYNYHTKEEINGINRHCSAMVVKKGFGKNIYHNLLDYEKEYLYMDIPLEVRTGCIVDFDDTQFNVTGKKEFVAFEINKINEKEYICLDDNSDISTINLLSSMDNYGVLLSDRKDIDDKTYYSVEELLNVNNRIKDEWVAISEYNSKQFSESLQNFRENIASFFKECTLIDYNKRFQKENVELDVINNGEIVFASPYEISFSFLNKSKDSVRYSIGIESLQVELYFYVENKDDNKRINIENKLFIELIKEDNITKVKVNYDESLRGQILVMGQVLPQGKYLHQYTSYLGDVIYNYTNSSYSHSCAVILG